MAELVGSLKLPKYPARDLKRALEQAASVRASDHHEKSSIAEICTVLTVPQSISDNRGAATATTSQIGVVSDFGRKGHPILAGASRSSLYLLSLVS